ncbi:MAG: hypothetical protein WEE89_17430 [Gemmatimonadota bacterium]
MQRRLRLGNAGVPNLVHDPLAITRDSAAFNAPPARVILDGEHLLALRQRRRLADGRTEQYGQRNARK